MNPHPDDLELMAWSDSALTPADHARVGGHLDTCDRCRLLVMEMQQVDLKLRAAREVELPPGLLDQIALASAQEHERLHVSRTGPSPQRLALALLATVLAVVAFTLPGATEGTSGLVTRAFVQAKEWALLLRTLRPLVGAVMVLAGEFYLPLLAGATLATLTLGAMAARVMGEHHPNLTRSA